MYTINGKEIEYNALNLDNMEKFEAAARELEQRVNETMKDNEYQGFEKIKVAITEYLNFFDTVLDNGSAASIFGTSVNVDEVILGYKKFIKDVREEHKKFLQQLK